MAINFNKNPIYWFSAGTIIRQLVGFIMLPIYTTFLSPSDYGIIALLSVIIAAFELFLGAQFGRSLPKFYFDKESTSDRDTVATTALAITMIGSSFGVLAFLFSAPFIASSVFEAPQLSSLVGLYSVCLLTTAIESYMLILFRLKDHPAFFFLMSVGKLICQLSLNIVTVVHLDMGVEGVMYSAILSSILFAGISLIYMVRVCELSFDSKLVKPLFIFTWPLWLAGGADVYVGTASNFVIKEFASLAMVGIFFLAGRFTAMMTMLVWQPFSQWWQTERFKIINDEHSHYKFPLIFSLVTYILLVAAVGLSIGSALVLKLMVNEQFYLTFSIIFILAFGRVLFHLTQFFYLPLLHVGKTKLLARLSLIRACFVTGITFPCIWMFGLMGAVYGSLTVSILVLLMVRRNANRCFDLKVNFQKTIALLVVSFFYTFFVINLIDLTDSFWSILYTTTVGLITFLVVLGITLFKDRLVFDFALDLFKKKKG